MNAAVYINGTGVISPQPTSPEAHQDIEFIIHPGNRLQCLEPDYSSFIDAKQIRRMSRIIKMGVVASATALKEAGIDKTDAIIVGTAFGCLEDTYSFLSKMVQYKEDMLSPTAFIHSTHNTIAAQIALHFKCYGYNSTYVHRTVSFESALTDAIMLLEEGVADHVLTGGIDEIIDAGFHIMNRLGRFKENTSVNGVVAGEGASFFSLSNKIGHRSYAQIIACETISFCDSGTLKKRVQNLLASAEIDSPDIILSGANGDESDDIYTRFFSEHFNNTSEIINFKHLCGEYGTASAFALWLAAVMIRDSVIPAREKFEKRINGKVKNILIYNQHANIHHSLILLKAC